MRSWIAVALLLVTSAPLFGGHWHRYPYRHVHAYRGFGHIHRYAYRGFHHRHSFYRHYAWGYRRPFYHHHRVYYRRPVYYGFAFNPVVYRTYVAPPVYRVYSYPTYYCPPVVYGTSSVIYQSRVDTPTQQDLLAVNSNRSQSNGRIVNIDSDLTLPRGSVQLESSVPTQTISLRSTDNRTKVIETDWKGQYQSRQDIADADVLFRDRDYGRAKILYEEAIRRSPELAEAHLRYAFNLIAQGDISHAAESLQRGLGRQPQPKAYQYSLDQLYRDKKTAKIAHIEYVGGRALADQEDADAFFVLGMMMYLERDFSRAEKFLRHALRKDPERYAITIGRLLAPPQARPGDVEA